MVVSADSRLTACATISVGFIDLLFFCRCFPLSLPRERRSTHILLDIRRHAAMVDTITPWRLLKAQGDLCLW